MNEGVPQIKPKQEFIDVEQVTTEEGGNTRLLSPDGTHSIEVERGLAENIQLALRVQEKIDDALMTGSRPGLLETISMMNCRKSVSAVRGTVPIKELVSRKKLKQDHLSREDNETLSGLPELWDDIDEILESRRMPVIGTSEEMHLDTYFEEHLQDLPAVVHIFDVLPRFEQEIVSKLVYRPETLTTQDCVKKMSRDHTFLVLGKDTAGNFICFQKQGPEIHHRFELRELSSLLAKTMVPSDGRLHLSFIGPIDANKEKGEEDSALLAAQ